MRIRRPILSLLLLVSMISYGHVCAAQTTITRVTSNFYEDSLPHIEGDYLVWQGRTNGNWEIFLHEISAGTTTQLTDNGYDDLWPQTDGEYVVWQGFMDGEWDVFLWDGTETWVISERGVDDVAPRIGNGFVVWTAEPMADGIASPSEIVFYDIDAQIIVTLSATVDAENMLDDTSPRIYDQGVSWLQSDDEGNTTIWFYNFSDGTVVTNPGQVRMNTPERDGDLTVVTRFCGGSSELFLYSQKSGNSWRITQNQADEKYPGISGNRIAWTAAGEIFLAEFRLLALVSPQENAVLSSRTSPTFVWEGMGYGEFTVEISATPDFAAKDTITLPLWGTSLSETSYTPSIWEWLFIRIIERRNGSVYWRVKGEDAGGKAALSEAAVFSVERIENRRPSWRRFWP